MSKEIKALFVEIERKLPAINIATLLVYKNRRWWNNEKETLIKCELVEKEMNNNYYDKESELKEKKFNERSHFPYLSSITPQKLDLICTGGC